MNVKKVCLLSSVAWVGVLFSAALYYHADNVSIYAMKNDIQPIHHHSSKQKNVTSTSMQDILHYCRPPSSINAGSEGMVCKDYKLESVNIIIRHGDRSSFYKVRNFSDVSCHSKSRDNFHKHLLSSFKLYMNDPLFKHGLGQTVRGFNDPVFLKSAFSQACQVGQLTEIGLLQGLILGHKLAKAYRLNNDKLLNPDKFNKVLVFSTSNQRTLLTSLALLFGLAPQFDSKYVVYIPVTSPFFCFKSCHCPLLTSLNQKNKKSARKFLDSHQEVVSSVKALSKVMAPPNAPFTLSTPQDIRDASLLYACHNGLFPCIQSDANRSCVEKEELNRVLSYTELELKVIDDYKTSLLLSHGLISQVVKTMAQTLKKKEPKLVIYSGHDLTLTAILKALDIFSGYPTYMSRLIFELYSADKKNNDSGSYFRVLYEGKDYTSQLRFCKDSLRFTNQSVSGSTRPHIWLCPLNNLTSFIAHSFEDIGTKNFQGACGG